MFLSLTDGNMLKYQHVSLFANQNINHIIKLHQTDG